MTRRRLAVPAYFHPAVAAADWLRLADAAGSLRAVVLNVDNGPGSEPESALLAAARLVCGGSPVLGYVDTDYGRRPPSAVLDDVARHLAWYPVSGVFVDRVAACGHLLPWYTAMVARTRELGAAQVVLNPGTVPEDPGYAGIADGLVTFEGPYSAYRWLRVPPWMLDVPAERFWHLVYETPHHLLGSALRLGQTQHAETIYVTDGYGANPWGALPPYFAEQTATWGAVPVAQPSAAR